MGEQHRGGVKTYTAGEILASLAATGIDLSEVTLEAVHVRGAYHTLLRSRGKSTCGIRVPVERAADLKLVETLQAEPEKLCSKCDWGEAHIVYRDWWARYTAAELVRRRVALKSAIESLNPEADLDVWDYAIGTLEQVRADHQDQLSVDAEAALAGFWESLAWRELEADLKKVSARAIRYEIVEMSQSHLLTDELQERVINEYLAAVQESGTEVLAYRVQLLREICCAKDSAGQD